MFIYENTSCPYCGQPLTEKDDLAVCPDCGTPHHRACYLEHGACANAHRHAEGFGWQPAKKQQPPVQPADGQPNAAPLQSAPDTVGICPSCGSGVRAGQRFCEVCGKRLTTHGPNFSAPGSPGSTSAGGWQQNAAKPGAAPFGSAPAAEQKDPLDEFLRPLTDEDRIDGIPVRDWKVYLGPSAPVFLSAFRTQDTFHRRARFNFGAFFLPTLYFMYYKAWRMTALSLLVGLLSLPRTLVMLFTPAQLAAAGISFSLLQQISGICTILVFLYSLFTGFFATFLIRVDAGRKIRSIRRSCSNEVDYMIHLLRRRCPSRLPFILLGCYMGLMLVSLLF